MAYEDGQEFDDRYFKKVMKGVNTVSVEPLPEDIVKAARERRRQEVRDGGERRPADKFILCFYLKEKNAVENKSFACFRLLKIYMKTGRICIKIHYETSKNLNKTHTHAAQVRTDGSR